MMINRLYATFIAFIAMGGAAYATPPSWQGTFIVTAVSSGCALSGDTVGEFGTILYRPIINSGDAAEGVSFFFSRSAETIISSNGSFRGFTSYNGVETGHHVFPNVFQGTITLNIQPVNITTATDQVHVKGHVNNFFNSQPACDVDIEASLIPRI